MMRSLFAGVSGLKNHQTRMDVIGNNIANVNTVGFKKSRVIFQDMLYQTLQSATSPSDDGKGGANPIQVGLGMSLATIDEIHTTGSFQPTGQNTDLSIEGDGFFMVGDGDNTFYTRAGNFEFNCENVFFHGGSGLVAKGILADPSGKIHSDGNMNIVDIDLTKQINLMAQAQATTKINFAKNLDCRAEKQEVTFEKDVSADSFAEFVLPSVPCHNLKITDFAGNKLNEGTDFTIDELTGEIKITNATGSDETYTITYEKPNYSMSVSVFDCKGDTHLVNVYFWKTENPNTWQVKTTVDGQPTILDSGTTTGRGQLVFDQTTGELSSGNITNIKYGLSGADELNIALNFENVTEYAGGFSVAYTGQDGYKAGYLDEIGVDSNGILNASFSNGQSRALAQLALATFSNPAGLTKIGNNLYMLSNNSGEPEEGLPGVSGRGLIKPETLEMSNVDLTQEFVDMIITQRGFQANSRVITTSDQILEELINLRR